MLKKIFSLSLKIETKEESMDNHDQISKFDIQFKNINLDEYTINYILFNVLSLHVIGHPSEAPLAIGTLVSLGPLDNQTYFVYVIHDNPSYQVLKVISKQEFLGNIDYLSRSSFIHHYFTKCKWQGFGLVWYDKRHGSYHATTH